MAQFKYIAKSRTGERQEGVLEASEKRTLMALLSRQGFVPVSITEAGKPSVSKPSAKMKPVKSKSTKPAAKALPESTRTKRTRSRAGAVGQTEGRKWYRFEKGRHGRPKMKMSELLLFTSELSDLLASGMTLGTALHALAIRKTGKPQDAIVTNLRDEIVQGTSLSGALSRWPESFPTLYISMVKAGEASGQLPGVLERLVRHYERVLSAREKVVMALVYPSIVAIVGLAAMLFMMMVVVPVFSQMFEDLGGTLPLPTRMLIGMSEGLLKYGWLIALLLVFGGLALKRALKTPAGVEWKDRIMLKLPTVGNIVKANAFANFAHTLSTLLANGVQVLQALSIVENTVGNSIIANAIHEARDRVTDGSSISRPLAQGGVFPQLLTDMLAIGEESGDMTGALAHIGHRYDNELDRAVKIFTTVLEPIMMLFIAVGVGFVAISMLMAVFELTSGLQT
ncbi:MAG: type II secretion system F family protein [Verrucomicrobiota bacterium]|jgi:type II secretory pathway component PulF|nr:type II secretion system F family protein [Verrucomicrobiota bacterium]